MVRTSTGNPIDPAVKSTLLTEIILILFFYFIFLLTKKKHQSH